MRYFFIATLLVAGGAFGQPANPSELEAVTQIARCLVAGLPDDWDAAHMVVELETPGASTGKVRYLVARKEGQDQLEPFTPCDTGEPPRMLVGLREQLAADRRGWTLGRLVVERDGSFRLNYEYPK
jgi:hypothetical protein